MRKLRSMLLMDWSIYGCTGGRLVRPTLSVHETLKCFADCGVGLRQVDVGLEAEDVWWWVVGFCVVFYVPLAWC